MLEKPIYVRNVSGTFNKEGPIEHTVDINILTRDRERTEIDMVRGKK